VIVKIKNNVIDKSKKYKSNISGIIKEIVTFFKEKGKKEKIKKLLKNLWQFIIRKDILILILMALPFVFMDLFTRIYGNSVSYYSLFRITPRLFSIAYIVLFIGISLNIKKKYSKLVYSLFFFFFYIFFIAQNIYYSTMNNFFGFSLMSLAGEGSDYFLDALKNCSIVVYLAIILVFLSYLYIMKNFPNGVRYNKGKLIHIGVIFLVLHIISKAFLGFGNFELTWDTWRNPRNVYNNFNDSNKCLSLTGLYEYTVRDFYMTYIKPEETKTDTESKFLNEVFDSSNDHYNKNKYTGKFKNKNVIFLQLEGIDDWLLTKDIMPNTYNLMNNSINFTNHYSFYNGGGSTFNSEFMVNVGYTTPYTFPMNAYTLNKNDFPYSMANLMKQKDYDVEVFHMNTREYYSRGINYYNWGYDNYLGLQDLGTYTDKSYQLDRELILNEKFHSEIFKNSSKTVSYIITYSNHLPFNSSKGVCNQLLKLDYKDKFEDTTSIKLNEYIESLEMTEEDCIKRQAKETDYMVGLLMQELKGSGLYNDTIIVVFADHYLYTVSDTEILKNNGKTIDNNLINKTPFFIWSAGMKREDIKKLNSQLDILPTFLNLMGVNYNEKWYTGHDILDNSYKSMIIFPDLSWYDGEYYVMDNEVKNKKQIAESKLEEMNGYAEYVVKKNDLVLKYNYFKEIMN
jgi:phosphoglycerol transferase MdoB-like AlkP superfamily enzyme